jgi:hypothetical protein
MRAADREPDHVPAYRLVLRPTSQCADPIRALRHLLKRALRTYGLKCTSIEQVCE